MSRLDEESLIEWIRGRGWPPAPFLETGIGDDCAVCLPDPGHELVVTTDALVEGRHFLFGPSSARDVGWKIAASNLSDVAAMGADPSAFFFSAAFPPDAQERFREVVTGLHECLVRYHTPLAGGDLSAGPCFFFSATVLGQAPQGTSLRRAGARPGDRLFVTGDPGFSGAGLRLLLSGELRRGPEGGVITSQGVLCSDNALTACVEKHLRPEPRFTAGRVLRESGAATAAIDTSDGMARDLRQICRTSGTGAELDPALLERLARGPVTLADLLGGGEDYELLVAVDPAREVSLLLEWERHADLPPLHPVGRVVADHPGVVRFPDGSPLPTDGFDHFRGT